MTALRPSGLYSRVRLLTVFEMILLAATWHEMLPRLIDLPASSSGWAWEITGFCGNIAFFSRWLIQWLHSEIHHESKVPTFFWWISIVGTAFLLSYSIHLGKLPLILGYIFNIIPYSRNLALIYRKRRQDEQKKLQGS